MPERAGAVAGAEGVGRRIPGIEPTANLVARSRMRLEEALDAIPPKRWFERLGSK